MKSIALFALLLNILFLAHTNGQQTGKLEGVYKPNGNCVPSSTCCCSTGTTSVTSEPPNTSVTVSGSLDGGTGCKGFNSLGAVFTVSSFTLTHNPQTIHYTIHILFHNLYNISYFDPYLLLRSSTPTRPPGPSPFTATSTPPRLTRTTPRSQSIQTLQLQVA